MSVADFSSLSRGALDEAGEPANAVTGNVKDLPATPLWTAAVGTGTRPPRGAEEKERMQLHSIKCSRS